MHGDFSNSRDKKILWIDFQINLSIRGSHQGSLGESHRMKVIGKPYSGKPNVRFDEGCALQRMEDCGLRGPPWQSLASSQAPSLARCAVTNIAKRRQGGDRPESKDEEDN